MLFFLQKPDILLALHLWNNSLETVSVKRTVSEFWWLKTETVSFEPSRAPSGAGMFRHGNSFWPIPLETLKGSEIFYKMPHLMLIWLFFRHGKQTIFRWSETKIWSLWFRKLWSLKMPVLHTAGARGLSWAHDRQDTGKNHSRRRKAPVLQISFPSWD